MSDWLMMTLQALLGIAIVFAVYRMALWLVKKDEMVIDEKTKNPKATVHIVDGYAYTTIASNRTWNTVNPDSRSYAPIKRSFNRKGGAQYSYSFWLYLEDTAPANVANKDILLRGDDQVYTYRQATDYDDGMVKEKVAQDVTDITIKAPRIRFGPTFDSFVVELNTLHNPNERINIDPVHNTSHEDTTLRHNLLKLMQGKWVLLTFTFEDNVAINDFEDGIIVRFFVNDLLYHTAAIKSAMRPNNGDFYLLPTSGADDNMIKNGRIGDVTYYNYALGMKHVREIFEHGAPKHPCKELMGDGSLGDPLHLSEYNKLDVYNT